MKIKNIKISTKSKPFIVSEMSGNHNGSLKRAIKLIDVAAESGASAIKIQTYKPDTITINSNRSEFFIKEKSSIWKGKNLYELYYKAHTPWSWHKEIFRRAEKRKIICFSTPFDETAVDLLQKLNAPCYKIASFECIDLPLIKKVAKTKKPLIISTGMATISEIGDAVECARSNGCKNLALLKCTSSYPSDPKFSNIRTIIHMRKLFNCEVGISDHTTGIGTSIAAISFGATIIEKHFKISKKDKGVDSLFSLDADELKLLVKESNTAWKSLGKIFYGPTASEKNSIKYRRSLYIVKDIKKGEILTKNNIKSIRPGNGILPKYLEIILNKKVKKSAKKGTPLSWSHI